MSEFFEKLLQRPVLRGYMRFSERRRRGLFVAREITGDLKPHRGDLFNIPLLRSFIVFVSFNELQTGRPYGTKADDKFKVQEYAK